MKSRRAAVCLSLLLLGLSAACVPYRPFTLPKDVRAKLPPAEQAKYRDSIRVCADGLDAEYQSLTADMCSFAVIEFDDQGELFSPQQLDDTLGLIGKTSSRDPQNPDNNRAALVVIFVHGWKNNASPQNEAERNLGSFKKVLAQLAMAEQFRGADPSLRRRPVLGVYLSWPGRTISAPVIDNFTFFGRKNAAERVARVSFSHAIQRLVSSVKGNKSATRGNPDSVMAVVGHSFGGLIVENTLLRTLTIETDDFSEFAADLAVLVNPANEAILARQFVQALKGAPPHRLEIEGTVVSQPLIVSVTSVGDSATGTIFPLAMYLKSGTKRMRSYGKYGDTQPGLGKQRFYYTHTPGHSTDPAELYSHALTCPFSSNPDCAGADMSSEEYEAKMMAMAAELLAGRKTIFPPPAVELGECRRPEETRKGVACIERLSFMGPATGEIYTMDRSETGYNDTGYWIMEMPVSIVPDHSEIFQSELASLLAAFINLKDGKKVKSLDEARSYLESHTATADASVTAAGQGAKEN
jgi:pimeloyl-ACP methyl ester carboxylesterase